MSASTFPWLSTIDAVVLFALGVVVPLSLGGPVRRWLLATGAALIAFWLPTGPAGWFVLPVVAVAAASLAERAPRAFDGDVSWASRVADVLPAMWATVAAGALAVSRAGWVVLGQREPFVELTAVHYLFAGTAALTLAGQTMARSPAAGAMATLATAAAPPVIAVGFVALAQDGDTAAALSGYLLVGGALLLTYGVWTTAVLQLGQAFDRRTPRPVAVLLAASGLSVFAPMVLAVLWAAATHWDGVPALSVPEMVRFHGLVNAFGFVVCGLLARHVEAPRSALRDRVLAEARAADLSYGPPVGHTLDPSVPMSSEHRDVGRGEADFGAAKAALSTWVAHHGVGFAVVPEGQPVVPGATVLVVVRRGPFSVLARNRIVGVVDEPRRFGFAYGTVHGHPERGEESFVAEWRADDTVRVTIRVDAGPASLAAKLAAPIVRRLQLAALRGYLRAVEVEVAARR